MLKEWVCTICARRVLAFEDDLIAGRENSFYEKIRPKADAPTHVCSFLSHDDYRPNLIHGEAGFLVEGTVLDSTDSIHEHESRCLEQAADARELRGYLEAMKNA